MAKELYFKVEPGRKVKLADYAADYDAGLNKDKGEERIQPLLAELAELQEWMYAAGTHSLLVVLQGMDTSGKDGVVRGVFDSVAPMGLKIASFKVPTPEEAAHDFLWRIHAAAPGKGIIGIFNRSHYEEVLVVRVEGYQPKKVWRTRYATINDFERLLTMTNTIVVKIYLHISKEEQAQRLIDRQLEVSKAWKLNPGDWAVRAKWDDYMAAYEDALRKCSTEIAPWYIVPSDRKWFRNLAIAELLVETLRPYKKDWEKKLADLQATMLPKVREVQEQVEGSAKSQPAADS